MSRVVLITGVAGGIGRATAQVFREAGWHVVGVDRGTIEAPAGVHRYIHADISDVAESQQIFAEVAAQEGRLDALVNNAAIQVAKPLVETTPEEWDLVMASNLRSVYLGVRHAYPLLRAQGGAIVNVSSVHAIATSANIAAYAASKGALMALTRALAIELAREKIRVNAVLPGAVDTPMLHAGLSRGHLEGTSLEELMQGLAARTVMGRIGQPDEIGKAILFLADERLSSFVTGQSLVVDGGATARLSTE
ncbi:SDR family oxidoreductase [Oscillochloris sp. ZM17-4]|uniref:SDR family NAD(P)-dependent oxidoreductase n=1 Tax=Oscillochloris sp. ZM17-4 TaxID=2866714 RepID=UPI001C733637|nr:SDR family oxidoreductase [Oscillochloris sp. ZM17-4]MBX0331026.1 SDR family oxidoreductase [Oscillochloris sp. ZM17-4]